jgi:tetratricopeptide (TPR) repeat protein
MGEGDDNLSSAVPADLEEELQLICGSQGFRRSVRLQRFLRHVVERATSAPDVPLTERQIARVVFDRRADFDPHIDPIVRVEAGRLRLRLTEYFAGAGQNDTIIIEIPRGGYFPTFRRQRQRGEAIDHGDAAYRLYLKGRYFWDKRSAESIAKAADYFRQAYAADAGFTRALTGIADCHLILATFEFAEPGPPIANARAAAESALRHDAQLAEARATVGCIQALYDRRWREADASFQLAMEIDRSYPPAWQWRGMCFCARGRLNDGLAALQAGAERDPVSLMVNTQLACGLYMARRYAEADESCSLVLEMDPNFWPARYFRGLTYEQQGKFAQAVRDLQAALDASGGNCLPRAALAHVHAQAGGQRDARRILRQLEREASPYVSPWALALVHAGLGDADRALGLLADAVGLRSLQAGLFLKTDPRLDPLRSVPRFKELESTLYAPPGD